MKKLIVIMIMCSMSVQLNAQSDEVQQLLLNIEKLAQFKKILKNMKKNMSCLYSPMNQVSSHRFHHL